MAGKKVNIDISTTANTSGANQTAKSLDNVAASANRVSKSNANVDSSAQAITESTQNASRSLLLFSQGLEDSQYGIRGVLNNIPGLIIALGGTAGLAGAISIAAVSLSFINERLAQFGDKAETAAQKAERLSGIIKQTAENAGEMRSEDLDFGRDALQEAIGYAQTLGTEFVAVAQRENAFSKQALDNQELLRQAALDIRRAKGEEINDLDEIAGKSQANAAKLRQEGEAAINVENAKRDAAAQTKQQAQEALNLTTQNFAKQQEQLELDRIHLANLEEEKKRLQELSKQRVSVPGAGGPGLGTMPSFASTAGAIDAKQQLESGFLDTAIAAVRAQIDESMTALEGERGKFSADVRRAGMALGQASLAFEQTEAEVAANIAAITQTMAASTVRAEAATLLDTQKALADEIKATIETAVPRTQADAQNIEILKGLASDGLIQSTDTNQALAALSQLQGVLNTGIGGVNTNVNELITLVRQLQAQTFRQERQIQELRRQQQTPANIR